MSETLISRNEDLAKLEAEGFRLRIVRGTAHHLLIDGIPAVNAKGAVVTGTLYCPLEMDQNDLVARPINNHQCWWIGDKPCDASGRVMEELISNPLPEDKGDGIVTTVGFSRKRPDQQMYADLHGKIWTYVELIWHPAQAIDKDCDPRSNKPVPALVEAQKTVFRYPDMATTRGGIGAATARLLLDRVAIIGIGGTGSYILDLLAKTPVREIHLFDDDVFEVHSAFRAPGAPAKDDFTEPLKVDWFFNIYDRMRTGIVRHPYKVGGGQLQELDGFDFVFVAIDDPVARKTILEGLIARKVPFIDVGIDVAMDLQARLRAMCRFTVGTVEKHSHIYEVLSFEAPSDDELYRNIQVADLNMQNAAMAVTKWKKLMGFYADDLREHHSIYNVPTHALSKEDRG